MSDETRPDANGCPTCNRSECDRWLHNQGKRVIGHRSDYEKARNDCQITNVVDWRACALRLVEEQRAKAMEAAARVWLGCVDDDSPIEEAHMVVAWLASGKPGTGHAAALVLEVLRAFEIVAATKQGEP